MRQLNAMVFDEYIPSAASPAANYTAMPWNERLGAFDKLSIMAVADNVSGTTPTVTVQIQHSADGRNWANKNTTAEINAGSIPTGVSTALVGSDTSSAGSLGFVRLAITMGVNHGAHIKVWITARDTVAQ